MAVKRSAASAAFRRSPARVFIEYRCRLQNYMISGGHAIDLLLTPSTPVTCLTNIQDRVKMSCRRERIEFSIRSTRPFGSAYQLNELIHHSRHQGETVRHCFGGQEFSPSAGSPGRASTFVSVAATGMPSLRRGRHARGRRDPEVEGRQKLTPDDGDCRWSFTVALSPIISRGCRGAPGDR